MSWDVGMPNLGHTMEEGTLASWLKSVGDAVASGEVIATVESDKATFDVEAPADGVLLAIHVDAGTVVPVGTIVGVVGKLGELPVSAPRRDRSNATPAARTLAAELGIDLATLTGMGEGGSITADDVRAGVATSRPATGPAEPSPMRRAIAHATEQAWRTIPHVTLMRRAALPGAGRPGNITALVVHAAARALR